MATAIKRSVVFLLIGGVFLLGIGSLFTYYTLGNVYRWIFSPYENVVIATDVQVNGNWQTITSTNDLYPKRERQIIIFEFLQPQVEFDTTHNLIELLPFAPQAELLDEYGNVFPLKALGVGEFSISFAPLQHPLPKDRIYKAIRVRSDKTYFFKQIYWQYYNPWDRG